jgi:molybdopterin biosynthesis enzyme
MKLFYSSETSVIQTLQSAFELADIIISTGGVSMGDKVLKSTDR